MFKSTWYIGRTAFKVKAIVVLVFPLLMMSACEEEPLAPTSPQLSYILANNDKGQVIYAYDMNPVSGIPELIGNAAGFTLSNASSIAATNTGDFLYLRTTNDLVYPLSIKKDSGLLQSSTAPTDTLVPQNRAYNFKALFLDPLNQFAFIIRTRLKVEEEEEPPYYPESIIEVYSLDSNTGSLTLKNTVGPLFGELRELVFQPSGKFIYGASHTESAGINTPPPIGTLFTFEMDRVKETVTVVDTGRFRGWSLSSGRAISLDPTGKFLFLIESSSFCDSINPKPPLGPPPFSWHTQGSRVRSYLVNQTTGLLTSAGTSMDISPEVFTWGEIHPDGEFIYFLSTHDFGYGSDCGGPPARYPTGIHSYYIQRDTGELVYTGINYGGGASKSIQIEDSGRFLYHLTSDFINIHNIDPATGTLEAIGTPLHGEQEFYLPGTARSIPLHFVGY